MRKTEACAVVARRLNIPPSRVTNLVQRCSEADLLPVASGAHRPELCARELLRIFLAATCDCGLGHAAATTIAFENLQTENGIELGDVLENLIRGDIQPSDLTIQLGPPSATLGNLHFGAAPQAGGVCTIKHIRGRTMKAIALEFQGHSQQETDTLIYLDTKSQLSDAQSKKTIAAGELREIEQQLSARGNADDVPGIADLRERGRELADEISSLDHKVRELTPIVAQQAADRKADAMKRVPATRLALAKLADCLDATSLAASEVERLRAALHQAGAPTFKAIPAAVLVVPGSRKLIDRALAELEAGR